MTALAPTLESFFTDYLIGQRGASAHTIAAYRDTFRLPCGYIHFGLCSVIRTLLTDDHSGERRALWPISSAVLERHRPVSAWICTARLEQ